jgi:regulator of protease activity HflC (stomatin/prohibitin superfamily)
MFKNASRKAIALGGISLAAAGAIGIGVEVTKAVTFEIEKARAATTAALAEVDKAKAEMQKAIAEQRKAAADQLRAENELLAAKVARDGAMFAAQFIAQGTRDAAKENASGLVRATEVDKYVDNNIYDGWTSRFIAPAKAIDGYNKEINKLKREVQSGISLRATLRQLISATCLA